MQTPLDEAVTLKDHRRLGRWRTGSSSATFLGTASRENRNTEMAVTKTPQYSFSHVLNPVPSPRSCRRSHGNIHGSTPARGEQASPKHCREELAMLDGGCIPGGKEQTPRACARTFNLVHVTQAGSCHGIR